MTEVREAADLQARIRRLEHKRGDLWSLAGGSKFAGNLYREFVDGRRISSKASLAMAAFEGYDLLERYRILMAEKLAVCAIAKAQARCITDEMRMLRAKTNITENA
jgi:hypothetical protein